MKYSRQGFTTTLFPVPNFNQIHSLISDIKSMRWWIDIPPITRMFYALCTIKKKMDM
jgi:hypothetical protein